MITDIRMPGLNGVELMRKARENGIKVDFILVSGYRDFEYARSAVQLGALDYLLKPINREELNRVLEKPGNYGNDQRLCESNWKT